MASIKKNILLIVIESLRYDRLFGSHIPSEYKMSKFLELARDSTTFHKCISVSNSSWMSAAAILMGNDKCYQHNSDFYWTCPYDYTTVTNKYSDPLFSILGDNGFKTHALLCPNTDFGVDCGRDIYHNVVDYKTNKKVNTMWGGSDKNIIHCENKKDIVRKLKYFYKKFNGENLAFMIWGHDDHFAFTENGPMDRLECYKNTSDEFGKIFTFLKKNNYYNNTDIYIIGDHGDSHFAFSELSEDFCLQHGTTPFHTTTHVPLIVKSNYLKSGERYDLVSNIDIYSTILKSLNINFKSKIKIRNCSSIDLKSKSRSFVVSQNKFVSQKGTKLLENKFKIMTGLSITDNKYVYVKNSKSQYLFNHLIDPYNVSNLLNGFNQNNKCEHQHTKNWFTKKLLKNIKEKIIPNFENILHKLAIKKYVRNDL